MQTHAFRRASEKYLINLLAQKLIDAGYSLVVNDGMENIRCATAQDVAANTVEAVDEATLQARKGDEKFWFYFVFGNDGYDVIADSTVNTEQFLEECGYTRAADLLENIVCGSPLKCDVTKEGVVLIGAESYPSLSDLLSNLPQ